MKKEFLLKDIDRFVDEFVLVQFDAERAWMEAREEHSEQQRGHSPGESIESLNSSGLSHVPAADHQFPEPSPDVLTSQPRFPGPHLGMLTGMT